MGARTLRMTAALAASLAVLSLTASIAAAAIVNVDTTPAKSSVAARGAASVTVQWEVERTVVDIPTPGTVSSPSLRILIGGTVAATLPQSLSAGAAGAAPVEAVRLREVVRIPEALIYRAVKERSALIIRRTFVDSFDSSSDDGQFEVRPSGAGFAAVAVHRLEIAFDDDGRTRVAPKGSELRAVAELDTAGVGLITGQWEVATGATTAGAPVFRVLSLVRQGVAGGGHTVITSPLLPTGEEGANLVRFRVIEPALAFAAPVLQYYVTPPASAAAPMAQLEVQVSAPRPGTALTADTRFTWAALPGAAAYQIAFYETAVAPTDEAPLAGVFVPGGHTEAALEPFTLAQMPAGRGYLWKVIAFDANGAVIGSSATREIYKP